MPINPLQSDSSGDPTSTYIIYCGKFPSLCFTRPRVKTSNPSWIENRGKFSPGIEQTLNTNLPIQEISPLTQKEIAK